MQYALTRGAGATIGFEGTKVLPLVLALVLTWDVNGSLRLQVKHCEKSSHSCG